MDQIKKVTRRLFKNSRVEIDFFMYLPIGMMTKGNPTLTINVNPVVFIRCKPNKKIAEEFDYAKAGFRVTPRNLYDVVNLFNTALSWFYTDTYQDLFLVDEDGKLIFNADYNKLSVKTHKGDYDNQIMMAIPTIIQLGDKTYEGLHLYINTQRYCIPLTYQEVSIIFELFKNLRFTEEISMMLASYDYVTKYHCYENSKNEVTKTPFDL